MAIHIGISSWTDKTLIACQRFYPDKVRNAEQRLKFYASRFPLVEVDSSYYALPDPHTAHHWVLRTPDNFTFNIKAFRLFTGHQTPSDALPADIRQAVGFRSEQQLDRAGTPPELREELWRRFLIAIEPLRMSGKLGAVHLQFSPRVRADAAGLSLLEECSQHLSEHRHSVEFRHRSWFAGAQKTSTLALLRRLQAVHTIVDSPGTLSDTIINTVPSVWHPTHPELAVVRLHGRNRQAWNRPGLHASSGRFVYEYSRRELEEIAEQLRHLARAVANTHVLLNTNFEDQGVRNATALRQVLGDSLAESP